MPASRAARAGPLGPTRSVLRPAATFPAALGLTATVSLYSHCTHGHRLEQLVFTSLTASFQGCTCLVFVERVHHRSTSTCFRLAPRSRPGICLPVSLAVWPWSLAPLRPEFSLPSSHKLQTAPLALLSLQLWVKRHHFQQCPGGSVLAQPPMGLVCASALQA